ncbi:MAG: hypothetical protein HYX21_02205 [Candidatus Yanofskybacteria bacterium]|nr:hypothetical protein [Candidatus Yanofskybacteria bacterium]
MTTEETEQKRFEEILESIRRRMAADALRGNPVGRKTYGHSPKIDNDYDSGDRAHYILDHE